MDHSEMGLTDVPVVLYKTSVFIVLNLKSFHNQLPYLFNQYFDAYDVLNAQYKQ
jgi:hypothetical protein